jgi:hypothetical protein
MVLVAVLERREETRLGCKLIDLIGEKKRYCCSSLLAGRLEKKEGVVSFGGENKIAGLLPACYLVARPNERQEKSKPQKATLLWWGEGKRRARSALAVRIRGERNMAGRRVGLVQETTAKKITALVARLKS